MTKRFADAIHSQVKELPQSPPSLDAYTWHASLTAYQEEAEALDIAAGTNGLAPPSGEDDSVVNAAVATIILPRLRKLAAEAYDPFSRSMTSKALHVVEEISYCLETSNQRFQVGVHFTLRDTRKAVNLSLCSTATHTGLSGAFPGSYT